MLKKFYFFNFCIFFFSSVALADNNTAYIDLDLILSKSKPSKLLFSQLKEIEKKKLKQLKNDEINLKEEEKKIINIKNIVSKDEYSKIIINIKKKIDNYQNIKNINNKKLKKNNNREY